MALLNLSKIKKNKAVDKPAEKAKVPEELPSLPEDQKEEAKPEEKKEDAKPAETAPDELPPVSKEVKEAAKSELAPQPAQGSMEVQSSAQDAGYFSELVSKLQQGGNIKDVEKAFTETDPKHIFGNLNAHWEKEKKNQSLAELESQITEKISPLQKLEQEWRSLKTELNQKTRLLKEKEEEIKNTAFEMRALIHHKNRVKNQLRAKKAKKNKPKPSKKRRKK